jgi:hypothetical protein
VDKLVDKVEIILSGLCFFGSVSFSRALVD